MWLFPHLGIPAHRDSGTLVSQRQTEGWEGKNPLNCAPPPLSRYSVLCLGGRFEGSDQMP